MSLPALVPALALLAGDVVGLHLIPSAALAGLSLAAAWCAASLACVRSDVRGLHVAAVLGFFAAGCVSGSLAADELRAPELVEIYERDIRARMKHGDVVFVEGELLRDAQPTEYGASLELALQEVAWENQRLIASGGILVSVAGTMVEEHLREWRAGRRVRTPVTLRRPAPYRNPGVPDQERAMRIRGAILTGTAKSGALVEVLERGTWAEESAASARAIVRDAVARTVGVWSARSAGIVTAVLIGDRAGLSLETTRRLQEAGTYHVIAISGGNIAILAGLLVGGLTLAGVGPRRRAASTIAALAVYAWTVGIEPPILRATLMAIVYLGARILDHRTAPFNAVAVTLGVAVLADPLTVVDAGFLLTFGATAAILLGSATHLTRASADERTGLFRGSAAAVVALGIATLSAELALLPANASIFSRVSFAGLGLNFLAIPLMTVVQIAGLGSLALSFLATAPASAVGGMAHFAAEALTESARLVEHAPWLAPRLPPPPLPVVIGYTGSLVACVLRPVPFQRGVAALVAAGCGAVVLLAPPLRTSTSFRAWSPGLLQVVFLDVAQGDATYVRLPDGRTMLIDAGGTASGRFDVGSRIVTPAIWAMGTRRLDFAVFTHGDPDHVGGFVAAVGDLRPRELWEGVPVPTHMGVQELLEAARERGAAHRRVVAGGELRSGDAVVRVLHPPVPDWERPKVRNDDSIVLEIRVGQVAFLLTGDIGVEVEPAIAEQLAPAHLRIVKVPHHGSRGSSSPEFVERARSDVAIVSAGRDNRFGHPAPEVVARYRSHGALVLQTDRHGAIAVTTDGRTAEVETMAGARWSRGGAGPR